MMTILINYCEAAQLGYTYCIPLKILKTLINGHCIDCYRYHAAM